MKAQSAVQQLSSDSVLDGLSTIEDFRSTSLTRERIYPSVHSVRWLIRRHRLAFFEAGALVEIAGRLWISPAKFDAVVMERAGTPRRSHPGGA